VRGPTIALLVAIAPSQAAADPPTEQKAYVVQSDGVHEIPASDWSEIHGPSCQAAKMASWRRAPSGSAEHCHGRLYADTEITRFQDGAARSTFATVGVGGSIWEYATFARQIADVQIGGGHGVQGLVSLRQMIGGAFSVPGLALRGGWGVDYHGARGVTDFWVEVPAIDVGYVVAARQLALEIGMQAAFGGAGGTIVRDGSTSGGLWGPYGIVSYRGESLRWMLQADVLRFERSAPWQTVDVRGCGGKVLLACIRARTYWLSTEEAPSKLLHASGAATTLSLSVGYGGP
jgi:hypothetical protein